jgi:glycosyltransferase involved in cell wall biosynthesis
MGSIMELPKVTFIIAHHNYEEYLDGAIQSALNQTYPNIHVCVIDDCSDSEDGSVLGYTPLRAIIEKYTKDMTSIDTEQNLQITNCPNFTFIQILDRPRGPSYARNRGIEYMWDRTDIFAILDADDENYPTKIEKCVKVIMGAPQEIGVVYADHFTLNTTTGIGRIEYREPFDVHRLYRECIVHSGSLITKYALENVEEPTGFYDELMRTCEDYDLWMRISEKFMIAHVAEPLSLVRVQPKNSTDTVSKQIWNMNYQRVFQKKQMRQNGIQNNS